MGDEEDNPERRVDRLVEELKTYLDGAGKRPLALRLDARDALALLMEVMGGREARQVSGILLEASEEQTAARRAAELVLWRDPKAHAKALAAAFVFSPLDGKSHASDGTLRDDYYELTRPRVPGSMSVKGLYETSDHVHFPPPVADDQEPVAVPLSGCAAIVVLERWYGFRSPQAVQARLVRIQRSEPTPLKLSVPSLTTLEKFLGSMSR